MSEQDNSMQPLSLREKFEAKFGHHALALEEIFCVTIVSLLPILFGTIIGYFQSPEEGDSISKYFRVVFLYLKNGELFLYCTSVLATVFYLASLDRAAGRFPKRKWFVTASVVCIGFSILFFTLRRVDFPFDPKIVFIISCAVYGTSIIMYFLLAAAKNADFPLYQEVSSADASNYAKDLENRKAR